MHQHLLQELGICIVAATALAYVARLVGQPLMLAYIGAGLLVGPIGLGWISQPDTIQTLAELGLAFLLFIVGLEIDLKKLADSGKVASIATVVQVGGSALLGWLAARGLGYAGLPAVYVGAAVAFSSTMIVVKLLDDRSELATLPGSVTLSVLLVQDVLAIVVLAVQPELGPSKDPASSPLVTIALSVGRGLGLVAGTLAVSRWILPRLFRWVATEPEAVLLSAVSWCFIVSFAAMKAGFSVAMGALIAGVSISAFPYSLDVAAKIQTLRDFFVTLFFVSLGMLITVPTPATLGAAVVISLVVVASRIVTLWPALRGLGLDNRTGLLSSLHLGQVSEFALVIVLIGATLKHVDKDVVSLIVLTLVITSTASTYLIGRAHGIVRAVLRSTKGSIFEDPRARETREMKAAVGLPLILVGCFRVASSLVEHLQKEGRDFSVIDFSPAVHSELRRRGVRCDYGDISHLDTLEHAGVENASILVASIPDDFLRGTSNAQLLAALKRLSPHAHVIVTADRIKQARELYNAGADYVLVPRLLAADRLRDVLKAADAGELAKLREEERALLENRNEVLQ